MASDDLVRDDVFIKDNEMDTEKIGEGSCDVVLTECSKYLGRTLSCGRGIRRETVNHTLTE